jgi:hypothetical protein
MGLSKLRTLYGHKRKALARNDANHEIRSIICRDEVDYRS